MGILKVTQRCFFRKVGNLSELRIDPEIQYVVRLIQVSDINKIPPEQRPAFKNNLEHSDGGMVADVGENVVGWLFFAQKSRYHEVIDATLKFDSDSAYIYNLFTVPNFRGLGIASNVLDKASRYLNSKGKKRVYITIFARNYPSIRAALKVGFREFGTVNFLRSFPFKIYRLRGKSESELNVLRKMLSVRTQLETSIGDKELFLLSWHSY
jgi:RimJ/RimL family protein N-acetyltransferase